ncbi:MAG: hypothetical protein OHK0019_35800 [Saprospiraceae bacterium]
MKKIFFLLVATVFSASIVYGQLTLRPYVGINSNSLTEDFEDSEWKSKIGYQVGVDLQIGSKLYVQPGVQLEFAKNQIESIIPGVDEDFEFKRTHVRIPVMVGYAFGEIDGDFAARIFTGPNASIVISSEADGEDIKDELKNAVFGWNVGAGVDFSILFLDLGYQIGLSEVFEDFNLGENGSKGNSFYANAGIRIRF